MTCDKCKCEHDEKKPPERIHAYDVQDLELPEILRHFKAIYAMAMDDYEQHLAGDPDEDMKDYIYERALEFITPPGWTHDQFWEHWRSLTP